MANKPNLVTTPKPPATATTATVSFGGCFGCSDVNSVAIIKVAASGDDRRPNEEKKKKPWFSIRSMKKHPVAAAGHPSSRKDDDKKSKSSGFSKSKLMIKWKPTKNGGHTPAVVCTVATAEKPFSAPSVGEPIPTIRTGSSEQEDNIILGNVEEAPRSKKRLSFSRNKAVGINDKPKNGPSSSHQPGSPVSNSNLVISLSTTLLPAPDNLHLQQVPLGRSHRKDDKKLDSVVGLSIITVTLVIMVVWGRFCAIVCTAAWLYFLPRLRSTRSEVGVNPNRVRDASTASFLKRGEYQSGGSGRPADVDLDSVEYKRRVVLEGLLDRKRRLLLA